MGSIRGRHVPSVLPDKFDVMRSQRAARMVTCNQWANMRWAATEKPVLDGRRR